MPGVSDLSITDKLKLRPPNSIDHRVETLDVTISEQADTTETTASTPAERLQKLLDDLAKQQIYAEAILDGIKPYAVNLTFAVPASSTEVRSALLALGMNPDKVSYEDYLRLLRLQLDISSQIAQEQTGLT
jgi:hypothetical protein